MSAFQFFKPKPGAFGRSFTVESVSVGTGGTSVANTATTSVILPTPGRKCQLVGLNINALVAAASTGTVTAQVFKRNNVPASPADVTLTATKSLKSDVVTTLQPRRWCVWAVGCGGCVERVVYFPYQSLHRLGQAGNTEQQN